MLSQTQGQGWAAVGVGSLLAALSCPVACYLFPVQRWVHGKGPWVLGVRGKALLADAAPWLWDSYLAPSILRTITRDIHRWREGTNQKARRVEVKENTFKLICSDLWRTCLGKLSSQRHLVGSVWSSRSLSLNRDSLKYFTLKEMTVRAFRQETTGWKLVRWLRG